MTAPQEGLYHGTVVHTRIRPVRHTLRYRVFAVLFDCDRIDALHQRLRLFSRNRFNLFSLHDRDHGDGTRIESYLRGLAERAGMATTVERFMMLCYPRILGYAFNPLTVYYGFDADGHVRVTIYEVNNTFGQRQTYVLPAAPTREDGLIVQSCGKELHVSPFNAPGGTYAFHVTPPGEELVVGVSLRRADGPVMKAYFRGEREPLTDAALLRGLGLTGWMTVNVIVGIHWEALKLRLKGLRFEPRPAAPARSIRFFGTSEKVGRP